MHMGMPIGMPQQMDPRQMQQISPQQMAHWQQLGVPAQQFVPGQPYMASHPMMSGRASFACAVHQSRIRLRDQHSRRRFVRISHLCFPSSIAGEEGLHVLTASGSLLMQTMLFWLR